jgi:integron integrase
MAASSMPLVFADPAKPKLLQVVRLTLRRRHYSYRTEQSYLHWIRRFVRFHNRRHPRDMGAAEVTAFLNHLAAERRVASATQNQALSALLFLYRAVLGSPLPWLEGIERAKRPVRRPTVVTAEEAGRLLAHLQGTARLVAGLLYGAGLRLREALSLRVKDVDFARGEILVREGKGAKDRITKLPEALAVPLREHLLRVRALHLQDLQMGLGEAPLPFALARKYPRAGREWGWQFFFPSQHVCRDPYTGHPVRFHLHESTIQRAVAQAARAARIARAVTPHTLRHGFATQLLHSGYDIRTVQELLGHKDVETTMIYAHVLNRGGRGVRSPLDIQRSESTPVASDASPSTSNFLR